MEYLRHVTPSWVERGHLLERATPQFTEALNALAVAIATGQRTEAKRKHLQVLIGDTLTLSDLLGRRRTLWEAGVRRFRRTVEAYRETYYAECHHLAETPVVPDVEFTEAVADIVRRQPELAQSAAEVAKVYRERHAFALAKSAELTVTKRVQAALAEGLKTGTPVDTGAKLIAEIGDWSRAYGETVYRTNMATAYSAGRFQQAYEPSVAEIMPAFEFRAVGDSDTRENHAAADGLVAATNDPVWDTFSPPMGYNCRCDLAFIDTDELEMMDLVQKDGSIKRKLPSSFGSARPDEGFGGRPDRRMYHGG